MSVATLTDVAAACVVTYTLPYLLGTAGYAGVNLGAKVGWIFGGISFLSFVFVTVFVPELSGRSLEEVDELFVRGSPQLISVLTFRNNGFGLGNSRATNRRELAPKSPAWREAKESTGCEKTAKPTVRHWMVPGTRWI